MHEGFRKVFIKFIDTVTKRIIVAGLGSIAVL
jgi:hypothetical protein